MTLVVLARKALTMFAGAHVQLALNNAVCFVSSMEKRAQRTSLVSEKILLLQLLPSKKA